LLSETEKIFKFFFQVFIFWGEKRKFCGENEISLLFLKRATREKSFQCQKNTTLAFHVDLIFSARSLENGKREKN
jgi:hypothetical protein